MSTKNHKKYAHPHPKNPQHYMFPSPPVKCVKKALKPKLPYTSTYLDNKLQQKMRKLVEILLYCVQVVDPKILMYLSIIESQ